MFGSLVVAGIVHGLVIGLAALAITLAFGIARFPKAAAGDTMTVGAYAAVVAHGASGSLPIAAAAAMAAAAGTSLLGYGLVFRHLAGRSLTAQLVAAIGLAFVFRVAIGLLFGHQQRVFLVPLGWPIGILGLRIPPSTSSSPLWRLAHCFSCSRSCTEPESGATCAPSRMIRNSLACLASVPCASWSRCGLLPALPAGSAD